MGCGFFELFIYLRWYPFGMTIFFRNCFSSHTHIELLRISLFLTKSTFLRQCLSSNLDGHPVLIDGYRSMRKTTHSD